MGSTHTNPHQFCFYPNRLTLWPSVWSTINILPTWRAYDRAQSCSNDGPQEEGRLLVGERRTWPRPKTPKRPRAVGSQKRLRDLSRGLWKVGKPPRCESQDPIAGAPTTLKTRNCLENLKPRPEYQSWSVCVWECVPQRRRKNLQSTCNSSLYHNHRNSHSASRLVPRRRWIAEIRPQLPKFVGWIGGESSGGGGGGVRARRRCLARRRRVRPTVRSWSLLRVTTTTTQATVVSKSGWRVPS